MSAPRIHPFWRLVLCAIVLLVVISVVQAIGLLALLPFSSQLGVGKLGLIERITQLGQSYALPLTVLSYPLAVGLLYLFRTRVDGYSWRSLGFSRVRALPDFARGALTALLTLTVLFSLMWLAGAIRFNGWSSDVQSHSALYTIGALLIFGVGFGAVGFFEETLFRGYALANLRAWLGWGVAVAVQAVVFAVIHLANGIGKPEVFRAALNGLPSIALIAVFFALAYRKTGSLWFPIGFHVAWNWLLGCVFSLPVSGIPTFRLFDVQETTNSFLSGGKFGAESSFFLIPLLLAMIYAMSLAPDHPRALANLDAPEPSQPFLPVAAPLPASIAVAVPVEIEDEAPRANRFGARFGSAEGFDSGMLRELTQMQEARETAERERIEADRIMRRAEDDRLAEIKRAQIAAQPPLIAVETEVVALETPTTEEEEPIIVAVAEETATPQIEPQVPIVEPKRATLEPRRATLEPRKPVAPAEVSLDKPAAPPTEPADAPPKKVRPRW